MAWIALFVAGLFEIVWAFAMKQSAGFTRLWPSVLTVGLSQGVPLSLSLPRPAMTGRGYASAAGRHSRFVTVRPLRPPASPIGSIAA
ncbi:MAG: hypothetical protein KKE69_03465, partial [Alphaproteobacteria bacterium]|nr:hypothetical protein [Alphaproteobacteria bacterium]